MKNQNLIDAIAPRLTELMIQRIEHLETDWQKPWITDLAHGLLRNLRGTPYRAGNILLLLFLSGIAGYQTPIFMTFRQAKEAGLNVVGVYDPFYAHHEDEMRSFCHRYIRSFTELL